MELDQAEIDRLANATKESGRVVVNAPPEDQKLGVVSVVCLILNRTIGSGIFVAPTIILENTNSVGISLLLWTLGAIVAFSGLLVWLELALTIPRVEVVPGQKVNVPRSGGEKNYLEYIYGRPRFLATCVFAVDFIIFSNASSNSVAFATYLMRAAGLPDDASAIRGVAIAAITAACLLHASWRKGGILLNNIITLIKVAILLLIIVLGFAARGGASFGRDRIQTTNFDVHTSFANPRGATATYTNSFIYIIAAYNGFRQPFYVLNEVRRPRKTFARATLVAVLLVSVLYILVNVAYVRVSYLRLISWDLSKCNPSCVVSKDQQFHTGADMATLFFDNIFGNEVATRIMSGILALSLFGNIVVSTFTSSRVKQEIAKEGVLPFSRFFARSTTTPTAKVGSWLRSRGNPDHQEESPEQSPAAALLLHLVFAVILIAATSGQSPAVAYTVLFSLYSYVTIVFIGFFVAAGLLYLRWHDRQAWTTMRGFRPWGGPTAAIIYTLTCAFLLVAAFLPPSADSAFSYAATHVQWYIVPTIGLASFLVGIAYFAIFTYVIPRLKGKELVVDKLPVIVSNKHGEMVMKYEVIEFEWRVPD